MKIFEYHIEHFDMTCCPKSSMINTLNRLGSEGWEAISAQQAPNSQWFDWYFKRADYTTTGQDAP